MILVSQDSRRRRGRHLAGQRRGFDCPRLQGKALLRGRQIPGHRHHQRLLPGPLLRHPRSPAASLGALGSQVPGGEASPDHLSLRRVSDGSPARAQRGKPRDRARRPRRHELHRLCATRNSSSTKRSRGSATAVWGGSPPATWTRWRRSTGRPSATASATSSASSTRPSATAGRSRWPTAGCAPATPGRCAAGRSSTWSASAATSSTTPTATAACR